MARRLLRSSGPSCPGTGWGVVHRLARPDAPHPFGRGCLTWGGGWRHSPACLAGWRARAWRWAVSAQMLGPLATAPAVQSVPVESSTLLSDVGPGGTEA